jgi:glycosyltransferase involved in cell wall biosynthesis
VHAAYVTETWPPEVNGVALTAQRTVEYLRAHDHRVTVIRPRQAREHEADDHTWLVPGLPLPMYRPLRFGLPMAGALRRRWDVAGAARPDVVHVATEGPLGASAIRAARQSGIPVTSDFRTNFHIYSRHYRLGWAAPLILRYLRRLHNRTALTCVPTEAMAATLARYGFERTAVVGRGVDVDRFSPCHRSATQRESWGAISATPVALHVGRLAAEKNVALVVRAFAAIKQRCPDAVLVWVGDGPLRARLQRRVRGAVFAGTLRDAALAQAYASADLFLFPSLTETFGNVTLEALASGLVVVAFDAGSAAVHIEHGSNGWLVPPGDEHWFVDAAADAAALLHALRPMRHRAVLAARRATWNTVLTRFESLLLRAALTPEQVEAIDTLVGEGPRVRPAVDARARATAGNA